MSCSSTECCQKAHTAPLKDSVVCCVLMLSNYCIEDCIFEGQLLGPGESFHPDDDPCQICTCEVRYMSHLILVKFKTHSNVAKESLHF